MTQAVPNWTPNLEPECTIQKVRESTKILTRPWWHDTDGCITKKIFGSRTDLPQSVNTRSTKIGMEDLSGQNPLKDGLEEPRKWSHGIEEFWMAPKKEKTLTRPHKTLTMLQRTPKRKATPTMFRREPLCLNDHEARRTRRIHAVHLDGEAGAT